MICREYLGDRGECGQPAAYQVILDRPRCEVWKCRHHARRFLDPQAPLPVRAILQVPDAAA